MGTIIAFIIIIVGTVYLIKRQNDRNQAIAQERHKKVEDERNWMERLKRQTILTEVLRQAKLVGDTDTVQKVTNHPDDYDGPMPKQWESGTYFSSIYPDRLLILNIAGINYRGNLKSYVGDFNGVLVPEPKNDYDPNAIMIKCEDGKHLGYIPENMTEDVRYMIGHPDAEGDTTWRHRITGHIDEREEDSYDDAVHKYFTGYINLVV